MPDRDMQTVRFLGSTMHGAIVEMPAHLDPAKLSLTITPAGKVFDRARGRALPGAVVVRGPQPRGPEPVKPKRRRRKAADAE